MLYEGEQHPPQTNSGSCEEKPRATVTDLATPDQTRCFHLELDPAVTVEELDHIADLPNIVSRYSLYIILNSLLH